jgi:hypothetical protein
MFGKGLGRVVVIDTDVRALTELAPQGRREATRAICDGP